MKEGFYPDCDMLYYGYPYSKIERLQQPISPRENYIRYYTGQEYEWIPDENCDVFGITAEAIIVLGY